MRASSDRGGRKSVARSRKVAAPPERLAFVARELRAESEENDD